MFKTLGSPQPKPTPKPSPKPSPRPGPKPSPRPTPRPIPPGPKPTPKPTPTMWCNIDEKQYCDPGYYCKPLDRNTSACAPCKCDVPGYTANPCRPYYAGPNEIVPYPRWCNLDEKDKLPIEQICDGKGTTNPLAGTRCDENGLCPDGTKCPQPGDGETQGMCPSTLCVPECMNDYQAIVRGNGNNSGYWWDPTPKNLCLENNWSPDGQHCEGTCSPCRCENEWQKPNTGIAGYMDPLHDVCKGSESSNPDCVNICPPGKFFVRGEYGGSDYCEDCRIADTFRLDKNGNPIDGLVPMQLANYAVNPHTQKTMDQYQIKQQFCNGLPDYAPDFDPMAAYPYWAITGCPEGFYIDKLKNQNDENLYACYSCECADGTVAPQNYKGCAAKDNVCRAKIWYPKYIACGEPAGDPDSKWGAGCQEISDNDTVNRHRDGVDCSMTLSDLGTPNSSWYAPYKCTPYRTITCTDGVCKGDTPCHHHDWWCCYNLCEKQEV